MTIRLDDPRPPYQQVADDLRKTITSGELAPGHRLPSTRELADQYGVAPMTVQNAVRVLRQEGLVVAHQGRGVYVRDPEAEDVPPTVDPAAVVEELRSMQANIRELDDRLSRVERLVRKSGPESPRSKRESAE